MKPAGADRSASPAENIDAILRLEKEEEQDLAAYHRLFHWIGWFVGTTRFIVLQFAIVAAWMAFNVWLPHRAIDEYPFPLLALILALEAVVLTSCVLIRQGTIDRSLERRDHLELQINLLAEREATRSLRILQRIAKRLDCDDDDDCAPDELARETSVDEIARDLRAREKGKPEATDSDRFAKRPR
ncbi:DUF1003 domain-containing protein [Bradyrhizobium arachidis]|jgi:uncharacterized membrane protein|uniref:DUF1003 domain-containing protein n=1 Tax=Bradyrhizobium arachidis TaxID=858423 RepID=A0AAE7NHW5_9BRAD|nr:DUF1003 domain-containing protein [Bradyrhizobium arachidis]QOZ65886.1 DUF1003 domain-containing protein [Bradyrhizobium arachidis]SFV18984.1 Uncharacterized membrane protein [Bradyrhizobium arachidis]